MIKFYSYRILNGKNKQVGTYTSLYKINVGKYIILNYFTPLKEPYDYKYPLSFKVPIKYRFYEDTGPQVIWERYLSSKGLTRKQLNILLGVK